jgi:hypothetical protein
MPQKEAFAFVPAASMNGDSPTRGLSNAFARTTSPGCNATAAVDQSPSGCRFTLNRATITPRRCIGDAPEPSLHCAAVRGQRVAEGYVGAGSSIGARHLRADGLRSPFCGFEWVHHCLH